MRNLFKYISKYKVQAVLGPLFKLFEALLELSVPLIVARIIDYGIGGDDTGIVVKYVVLLCLIAAVGFAFAVTAQYFAAKAAVGSSTLIRHDIYKTVTKMSFTQVDNVGTSTLITRLTGDVNLVQTGINLFLRLMLRSPFVVVGSTVMAFLIDVRSALVFVGVIIGLSLVVSLIASKTIPLYKKIQSQLDTVLGKTKESLSGARVTRAFALESKEEAEYKAEVNKLNFMQQLAGRVSSIMNPATYCIVNLGIVALIYIGAFRVESGALTQGNLVALYNYMAQILVELVKFASLIVTVSRSVAGFSRINGILDIDTSANELVSIDDSSDKGFAVEFDNVDFCYDNAAEKALVNISFSARRGERIGVIGSTGSGRSTLANLIPGFYKASKGTVRINGRRVDSFTKDALNTLIGIVPQKAVLFSGTIRDNLLWGNPDATDEDISKALNVSQSVDIIKSKTNGLDSRVEAEGRNFSGGQRQRLTIARALVKSPEILIFDDSASALDYATDAKLRLALAENYQDSTIFIISQRTSSIMHCDKILVLDDGEVVGIGTHDTLLVECEKYREIYYSQYKKEDLDEKK